jgi:hypothetical protein
MSGLPGRPGPLRVRDRRARTGVGRHRRPALGRAGELVRTFAPRPRPAGCARSAPGADRRVAPLPPRRVHDPVVYRTFLESIGTWCRAGSRSRSTRPAWTRRSPRSRAAARRAVDERPLLHQRQRGGLAVRRALRTDAMGDLPSPVRTTGPRRRAVAWTRFSTTSCRSRPARTPMSCATPSTRPRDARRRALRRRPRRPATPPPSTATARRPPVRAAPGAPRARIELLIDRAHLSARPTPASPTSCSSRR